MSLYEHVFISRQDLSVSQAESLIDHFSAVLTENGGKILSHEYWGLKTMAYKINKNRKGHYVLFRSDSSTGAVQEMERLMRLHEDIMRVMTIKVKNHEDGPSAVLQSKARGEERVARKPRQEY
jgi:small subunit ribosomal protein S6